LLEACKRSLISPSKTLDGPQQFKKVGVSPAKQILRGNLRSKTGKKKDESEPNENIKKFARVRSIPIVKNCLRVRTPFIYEGERGGNLRGQANGGHSVTLFDN